MNRICQEGRFEPSKARYVGRFIRTLQLCGRLGLEVAVERNRIALLLRRSCWLLLCSVLCVGHAVAAAFDGIDDPRRLTEQAAFYENGEGVARDYTRAAELYCRAAYMGYAEAQYGLGWMYANGRGVARDDAAAAALFTLAAKQGHGYAKRMLHFMGGVIGKLPDCMRDGEGSSTSVDTPERRKLVRMVRQLAPLYQVDPRLALAIIAAESNFNVTAVSSKNARGLMQLIPDTAARFKVKNAFDPAQNVCGGLAYLRWLLAYYKGDVVLVIASYNAGENAVDRYRGVPPYPETRNYVQRVVKNFQQAHHPYEQSVTTPSPALFRTRLAAED